MPKSLLLRAWAQYFALSAVYRSVDEALSRTWMTEQDRQISAAVAREQHRLRGFIRKWVADEGEVEDILQDVFYELVEAFRLAQPIEQIGAWMFRVARNRITDLFRKRRPVPLQAGIVESQDGEPLRLTRAACFSTSWKPLWTSCLRSSERSSSRTRWRGAASKRLPRRPASASTRCSPASTMRCFIYAGGCAPFTTTS